jgi:hypothetical protein
MAELASPDEPPIATAGTDPGRRKAAAQEARGAWIFAVTIPATTLIPVGAGETRFLRVWQLQPSDRLIENLKLRTA